MEILLLQWIPKRCFGCALLVSENIIFLLTKKNKRNTVSLKELLLGLCFLLGDIAG